MRHRCPAMWLLHKSRRHADSGLQPGHVKRIVRAAIPVKAAQPISVENQEAIILERHLARRIFEHTGEASIELARVIEMRNSLLAADKDSNSRQFHQGLNHLEGLLKHHRVWMEGRIGTALSGETQQR